MEAHIELIEGVKANRVAARIAVGLVVRREAEDGVGGLHTLQDWVLQRDDILIAIELDALCFGDDRVAGPFVGALDQDGADRLGAVGGVG